MQGIEHSLVAKAFDRSAPGQAALQTLRLGNSALSALPLTTKVDIQVVLAAQLDAHLADNSVQVLAGLGVNHRRRMLLRHLECQSYMHGMLGAAYALRLLPSLVSWQEWLLFCLFVLTCVGLLS
jgi:hypothetical protein